MSTLDQTLTSAKYPSLKQVNFKVCFRTTAWRGDELDEFHSAYVIIWYYFTTASGLGAEPQKATSFNDLTTLPITLKS